MENRQLTRVMLFTSQIDSIAQRLQQGKTHYAKMIFIKQKYGDVSKIFVDAYQWYVNQAELIVPRPPAAESAVWAFRDLTNIERHEGCQILQLTIPVTEGVYFQMSDWFKILNFRYVGQNVAEEDAFADKLKRQGIAYEGDIFLKPFYPALKQEVVQSWRNLFRFHEEVKQCLIDGIDCPITDIQVGLWQLDPHWLKG